MTHETIRLGSIIENGGYIIRNVDLECVWVLIDANDNIIWNTTAGPYKLKGKEKIIIFSRINNGTEVEFIQVDMPEAKLGTLITSFYVEDNKKANQFTNKVFGKNSNELKAVFKSFSDIHKILK